MRQVCRQQCQPHAEAVFRPVHPAEVQHRQPEEACQHAHLPDTKALCLSAENTLPQFAERHNGQLCQRAHVLAGHVQFVVQLRVQTNDASAKMTQLSDASRPAAQTDLWSGSLSVFFWFGQL